MQSAKYNKISQSMDSKNVENKPKPYDNEKRSNNFSNEIGVEINKDSKDFKNVIKKDLLNRKRKILKLRKISQRAYTIDEPELSRNNIENENDNAFTKSEISSNSNEFNDNISEDTVKSLMEYRYQIYRENSKKIEIRNIKTNEKIALEKVDKYLKNKDTENLKKYKFTYISMNDFNHYIRAIDLKLFRKLLFSCPICKSPFKHFSISYHIFQNHFSSIEDFLTDE